MINKKELIATIKVLRKFIPGGGIVNPAMDLGKWAAKRQQRRGHTTGIGSIVKRK